MTVADLQRFLREMDGGWVNWESTVDTLKSGSPDVAIKGIVVAWMSTTRSLERALERGCNVFITHEPTYYNHHDNDERIFRYESVRAKREFLEHAGMVVMRCHDLWDQVRGIGIPDSWAQQLGFSDSIAGEGYYRVYDVSGRTAEDVAKQIARATKPLGQEAVQLIGEPDRPVTRCAIGTGAITPFMHFLDAYNADLAICSDDGFSYWRDGALALDMGVPAIVVNHAVTEVHGMELLADHIRSNFPELPVYSLVQSCTYRLIQA
ncbi:hypothetical protein FJZ36_11715 [Candidatus Poribacteria bacterium]|nr:hypothetical protein [Candidatus Poribacteria bacterium]